MVCLSALVWIPEIKSSSTSWSGFSQQLQATRGTVAWGGTDACDKLRQWNASGRRTSLLCLTLWYPSFSFFFFFFLGFFSMIRSMHVRQLDTQTDTRRLRRWLPEERREGSTIPTHTFKCSEHMFLSRLRCEKCDGFGPVVNLRCQSNPSRHSATHKTLSYIRSVQVCVCTFHSEVSLLASSQCAWLLIPLVTTLTTRSLGWKKKQKTKFCCCFFLCLFVFGQ